MVMLFLVRLFTLDFPLLVQTNCFLLYVCVRAGLRWVLYMVVGFTELVELL